MNGILVLLPLPEREVRGQARPVAELEGRAHRLRHGLVVGTRAMRANEAPLRVEVLATVDVGSLESVMRNGLSKVKVSKVFLKSLKRIAARAVPQSPL